MERVPENFSDLLSDEKRAFLILATVMSDDGTPQATPIWFNHDGDDILINTAKGRVKDRNIRANPVVAGVILDPDNPYRYMQIRGPVVEVTDADSEEHIRQLAMKYHGKAEYDVGSDTRVMYRICPEHVQTMG